METDDELITASIAGDERALSILMDRYLSPVYSFALSITSNKEDAEDIAQETFFKAWKNLKRFKLGAPFKTWLFAIARNTAIDYARKKKPALFAELIHPLADEDIEHSLADTTPQPDVLFETTERVEFITHALSLLSPLYREILTLHYREEFTLQEISGLLDIPLNTVKSRDRRALQALRELLAPKNGLVS